MNAEGYVEAPDLPAGDGWCEAVVIPAGTARGVLCAKRHCATHARFERDGRRVCGLHIRASKIQYGPVR